MENSVIITRFLGPCTPSNKETWVSYQKLNSCASVIFPFKFLWPSKLKKYQGSDQDQLGSGVNLSKGSSLQFVKMVKNAKVNIYEKIETR